MLKSEYFCSIWWYTVGYNLWNVDYRSIDLSRGYPYREPYITNHIESQSTQRFPSLVTFVAAEMGKNVPEINTLDLSR